MNVYDDERNGTTPVDFFNVDLKRYPLVAQFNWIEAVLEAGDCLYVPAYYYVQTKTLSDQLGHGDHLETIMIWEQYESHSKLVDVMMEALESENITDNEKQKYEKSLDKALKYLYGAY